MAGRLHLQQKNVTGHVFIFHTLVVKLPQNLSFLASTMDLKA